MPFGLVAPVMKFISSMFISIIGGYMKEKLYQVLTSGSVQTFLKFSIFVGSGSLLKVCAMSSEGLYRG